VCGISAGCALFAAPSALAADVPTPPKLTADLNRAIDQEHLGVQVINGWEAVTGPASQIDDVRVLAFNDKIGTIADYTGDNESGRAILIFTGDHQPDMGFGVTGATVSSEDNDTDQTWYVYTDDNTLDATVPANTAENIPPADLLDFTFNIGLNGGQSILGGQSFRL
jgi:hypothetical protein